MKEYTVDIEELTDSRELLYANPHFIIGSFIYLILFMLIVGFVWICFAEIDEVVNSTGVIRPIDKISIIKNVVAGSIKSINYKNGDYVKKGDLLFCIEEGPYSLERDNLSESLIKMETKLNNLKLLEKSILNNKNFFKRSEVEYFNRFLLFKYELENLEIEYYRKKNIYDKYKLLPKESISKLELEDLRLNAKNAEINKNKFVSETYVDIKNIMNITEEDIKKSKERLILINKNIEHCNIKAPIDGKVQVIQEFNINDYIYEEIDILRIVPSTNSFLKVDIMVSNKDIANIKKNAEVQYRFLSLPYNEYGIMKGKITNIPSDTSRTDRDSSIYILEGKLNDTVLYDKKGNKGLIKIGMICNVSIVKKKKKVIRYLLEQLNFF